MRLSTKGRYGLRAMVDLAANSSGEPVSLSSVAERQQISERYLEQLIALLKKNGLVVSVRGANGGYVLGKDLTEISVGDVLRALEGNQDPVECNGLDDYGDGRCENADSCVTKYVWQRINDSFNQTVDEITLEELVTESREMALGNG